MRKESAMKTDDIINEPKLLMNVQQASIYLGIKVATLYEWVSMRRIPHFKIGGRALRFDRYVLDQWIEEQHVKASREI